MRYFFSIIVISLFTVTCNEKLELKNSDALVKVKSKILYKSVLEENIPQGLSSEDSIIAAENYIRTWINDILLYDIALKNINSKENIDHLVENYRKSLFIYQYEEQLVNERLTREIDEQSLYDYYNNNKDKLKQERPLVKGFFIKVPIDAPQLNEIRALCKSTTSISLENLEKYSLNNSVVFNFFIDTWMDFVSLMENFPEEILTKEDLTVQRKIIEERDSTYLYLLNITDYLSPGDNAPYEYAKNIVQGILINQRKIDFLKKTENDLFQRALDKGEIQFYN